MLIRNDELDSFVKIEIKIRLNWIQQPNIAKTIENQWKSMKINENHVLPPWLKFIENQWKVIINSLKINENQWKSSSKLRENAQNWEKISYFWWKFRENLEPFFTKKLKKHDFLPQGSLGLVSITLLGGIFTLPNISPPQKCKTAIESFPLSCSIFNVVNVEHAPCSNR